MLPKLILTIGLPRSGKTTWARNSGYPIVNRDSIRLALHGQIYLAEAESMITAMEDYMVKALILAGHETIVIDATHITPTRRARWINPDRWELRYKVFPLPMEDCIKLAKQDNRPELIPVIERMAENWDLTGIYLNEYRNTGREVL